MFENEPISGEVVHLVQGDYSLSEIGSVPLEATVIIIDSSSHRLEEVA